MGIARHVEVFIEAERGSRDRGLYGKDRILKGRRGLLAPYPFAYGFIVGTTAEDGDGVDCYIVSESVFREGELVSCIPIGLIEQFEGDEVDHKVIARPTSEKSTWERDFAGEIRRFVLEVFKAYPEIRISLGELLPAETALEHIQRHRDTCQ